MQVPGEAVGRLVAGAGLAPVVSWEPVAGGANNRVWKGRAGETSVLLKSYFYDAGDPRDRLRGEHTFYSLARLAGCGATPADLGWDLENRLGLFEFVEGRKLVDGEVDGGHVEAAARLVVEVNGAMGGDVARVAPVASEACFSPRAHMQTIAARVERLGQIAPSDETDAAAVSWIHGALKPAWEEVSGRALEGFAAAGMEPDETLPEAGRWISPSDFGFHNALLTTGSVMKFFDFEYAGWDDPAKMIADFFCQPAVPVPARLWENFVGALGCSGRWTDRVERSAAILLPAYRIKWCCIMMNEFLRVGAARRQFSGVGAVSDRRTVQLEKARKSLDSLLATV